MFSPHSSRWSSPRAASNYRNYAAIFFIHLISPLRDHQINATRHRRHRLMALHPSIIRCTSVCIWFTQSVTNLSFVSSTTFFSDLEIKLTHDALRSPGDSPPTPSPNTHPSAIICDGNEPEGRIGGESSLISYPLPTTSIYPTRPSTFVDHIHACFGDHNYVVALHD